MEGTPIKIRMIAGRIVHTNSKVCRFPNTFTTKKLNVKEYIKRATNTTI